VDVVAVASPGSSWERAIIEARIVAADATSDMPFAHDETSGT